MMLATDVLRKEHEVIQRVLDCLEELAKRAELRASVDVPSALTVVGFLASFVDLCHHAKEEQRLFPALAARALGQLGPIAVMRHEHELGRAAIRNLRGAVEAAQRGAADAARRFSLAASGCVRLLRAHIEKENDVLFSMAERVLDADDQRALLRGFERLEHDVLGPGTHEHYVVLARSLCTRLDVEFAPRNGRARGLRPARFSPLS